MIEVAANVMPHDHEYEGIGPVDIRIGSRHLPDLVKNWHSYTGRRKPLFKLAQPNEDDNFTVLYLLFSKTVGKPGHLKDIRLHRATYFRYTQGSLELRVRARHVQRLPHPLPFRVWYGTLQEGPGWVAYTLQGGPSLKLRKTEEKRTILLPGDPDFESTGGHQAAIRKVHDLAGGSTDPS
jgi:hypothetical protein